MRHVCGSKLDEVSEEGMEQHNDEPCIKYHRAGEHPAHGLCPFSVEYTRISYG